MSNRDRKLVWTTGVATLLMGGFFIGRFFGGDNDATPPSSGNEIAAKGGGSDVVEQPDRIPKEPEKVGDDGRLVSTPPETENGDSRQNLRPIRNRPHGVRGSHPMGKVLADPVTEKNEKKHVPSMGAVEL